MTAVLVTADAGMSECRRKQGSPDGRSAPPCSSTDGRVRQMIRARPRRHSLRHSVTGRRARRPSPGPRDQRHHM